jgi:hypothetical protein
MYLELFHPLTWMRRCSYIGIVLVWGYYYTVGAILISYTVPKPGQGWVTKNSARSFQLTIPSACFSLVADLYIWVLPLIAISKVQSMSRRRKLGVVAMFSTGGICCIASSVTVYFQYKIKKDQNDFTHHLVFNWLSYTIETGVGISASCMPSLGRLCKHHSDRLISLASFFGFTRNSEIASGPKSERVATIGRAPVRRPWQTLSEVSLEQPLGLQSLRNPSEAKDTN